MVYRRPGQAGLAPSRYILRLPGGGREGAPADHTVRPGSGSRGNFGVLGRGGNLLEFMFNLFYHFFFLSKWILKRTRDKIKMWTWSVFLPPGGETRKLPGLSAPLHSGSKVSLSLWAELGDGHTGPNEQLPCRSEFVLPCKQIQLYTVFVGKISTTPGVAGRFGADMRRQLPPPLTWDGDFHGLHVLLHHDGEDECPGEVLEPGWPTAGRPGDRFSSGPSDLLLVTDPRAAGWH